MIKFIPRFIFLLYFFKQSLLTDKLKTLLEKLKTDNSEKQEIALFEKTPNHNSKNCLFVYSPERYEEKFSGLVCYKFKVFYKKIRRSKDKRLVLWVENIFTAYMTRDRKDAEPTIEEQENGKFISYQVGFATDWLNKQKYKFLFLENKAYAEEKSVEINFNNPNPTELSIYPKCGASFFKKKVEYVSCNSSEIIEAPFGLGVLHFNFILCEETIFNSPVLAYDVKVSGNFRDGLDEFEDERFGNVMTAFSILDILESFSKNRFIRKMYDHNLIRIPTETEVKILEEKSGSIFNLEDGYFKQNGYFESTIYKWTDSKIFSDEDYEKYKTEEEIHGEGVNEEIKGVDDIRKDDIERDDYSFNSRHQYQYNINGNLDSDEEESDVEDIGYDYNKYDKNKDKNGKKKRTNDDDDDDDEKRNENKPSTVGVIIGNIFFFAFLGSIGYCIYCVCCKKSPKL